jgi:hypothetical protein
MANQDELWIYTKDANPSEVATGAGTPVFKLKITPFSYDLSRSIKTDQKVPGKSYSKGNDPQTIAGLITVSGEFVPTDDTWNASTFEGRPLDFIHYLKCLSMGLDPTTGNTQASSNYNCFHILLKQEFNGTLRLLAPGIFGTTAKCYYMLGKVKFDMDGSPARIVKWSIPLVEVSDAVNLGRV